MESVTQNRGFSPKTMAGAVNAGDLMAEMKALSEHAAARPKPAALPDSVEKSQVPTLCSDMVKVLRAAREADLNVSDLLVLLTYVGTAGMDDGDCVVRVSHPEAENITGLNLSALKRSVSKLTQQGCLVRGQARKVKGCAATTLVTDKGFGLIGLKGGAEISGFTLDIQNLLVNECHEVIALVKTAWDGLEMLPDAIKPLWRGTERDMSLLQVGLANRISDAQEALMGAVELQAKRDADESAGVYYIDAVNGTLRVDKAVLLAFAQYSYADVKFGVETLNLLSKAKPGMVTCARAPELLAEVLYSRTFGFAVKGEYEKAQAYLVNTMRKGWSRPKSIRDYWYVATAKACSTCLSTDGPISVH